MQLHNNPLVCICIPNYNNESTLPETLDSLVNQTYKNIIIKVFDNASTDKSIDVLKVYEDKYSNIQVIQNEINIGGEANFTKCFDNADGKYTAVFHSDDVYDLKIVEKQVDFLENNINCSAVATHSIFIDENSNIIGEHFIPPEIKDSAFHIFNFIDFFKISLKYGNIITCPSVMSKTELIMNTIQNWNFEEFKTSADFDVWLRLSKEGSLGFINEALVKYRMSNASYSYVNNRLATRMFDMFLVFEKYLSDSNVNKYLSKKDYNNYYFQYNKSSLSVNINRYLLDKEGYIKEKSYKYAVNKKSFMLILLTIIFNLIKFIKLPKKLKKAIVNKKVNGKWFQ